MPIKDQADPVAEDEWLLRLVWEDRISDRTPAISANAFEPRKNEVNGISFFRRACVADPGDVLVAIAPEKRDRYGIVQIPVALLVEFGFTVRPDPIAEVPGHVVIPEMNSVDYANDKGRFTRPKQRLAEVAGTNILRRPIACT